MDFSDFHVLPDRARLRILHKINQGWPKVSPNYCELCGDLKFKIHKNVDPSLLIYGAAGTIETTEDQSQKRIKRSFASNVTCLTLICYGPSIKLFALPIYLYCCRFRWHLSRARRNWDTACFFTNLRIGTPAPMDSLEVTADRLPRRSPYISLWNKNARTIRHWIRTRLPRESITFREAFIKPLLFAPGNQEKRTFLWTGLESVVGGTEPTQRQVFRNLVQLGGSASSKLSDVDPLDCLMALGHIFPGLRIPEIPDRIWIWTLKQLSRELPEKCNP